jgi:type I restriction enzyme S subunit
MSFTFYKETNFKETSIGKIPKDWKIAKVNELFDVYKGTTPSTKIKEYWSGTIPFVTPTDITKINDLNEIYLKTTENYITEKGLKSKGLKLVPKDSILFTSRATIGYLAINKTDVAINQGIISLTPKNANIDVTFFYYFLQKLKNLFENLAGGSTYKEISMSTFSNADMPIPSLLEQQKIAEILYTVDETIQKTNEVIAKTEHLKKGLMQELLTKGIGHKEFKDTEIGRIPRDWEVVKLERIFSFKNGQRPKLLEAGKIPVYGANGIMGYTDEFLVDNDFTIVVGRVGASGEVHLGQGEIWISDNAIYSESYEKSIVYPPFVYYLLKFKGLSRFASKTTHPIITQTFLNNFQIQLPSTLEQQKIAEILSTVDKKLEIERNEKAKLERIKQGLMDLLLTGKIRVKV